MRYPLLLLITVVMCNLSQQTKAQTGAITGIIVENDSIPVIGATIRITTADSSISMGGTSNFDGVFNIEPVPFNSYQLDISYLGMAPLRKTVNLNQELLNLGTIILKNETKMLDQVVVQAQQIRSRQIGDTTEFNAGAFKTNPDASAEDLISKMPGVINDNGTVKVQGEDVKKVLVDGKPFFGDDPSAALKNLPAEVVERIQVFEQLSDQSQFTGFDDGQGQKTINIITKPGTNKGVFGKLSGGYGTNEHYAAGGNINIFNGDQRISIIGLSNNINQQNFSSEDLAGVMGSSGNNRSRGGRSGGGRPGGGNDFFIGQQAGITNTNSIGFNYSDNWGKKIKVTGSYFYNNTINNKTSNLERTYFTANDSSLNYAERSQSSNNNTNHRFNLRLDYNIDSFNSVLINPRVSIQDNHFNTDLNGTSSSAEVPGLGNIINSNQSQNLSVNFSNTLLYRRRFAKKGRTASASITTQFNNRDGNSKVFSINEYNYSSLSLLDQESELESNSNTISADLNYTEPIGKYSQIMIQYNPSFANNSSDKQTFNQNPAQNGAYTDFDSLLSNKYDNNYNIQRGGLSYRYNQANTSFTLGASLQQAVLEGEQFFPRNFHLKHSFTNLLPNASANFKFDKSQNLRIIYRTATRAPSISQLQEVPDITNPLLIRTGNANLIQDFSHSLTLRYGISKTETARSIFIMANASYIQDYIGMETIIPTRDSVLPSEIVLPRGSQLTRPVNLNGAWNARTFLTFASPIPIAKSNFNTHAGFNFSRIPSKVNGQMNFSNNYAPSAGIVLSSNISQQLDFIISYTGNYNMVRNSLQQQSNNDYFSHLASAKINWMPSDRIVLNTNLDHRLYSGLNSGFDQQFLLWNAFAGYKLLRDRSLEARISVYDLLNQNKSIVREITDTYIEDSETRVLTQYFMFSLTYTFRNFSSPTNNQ